MADTTDFDEFVRARSHRLLRLAFLLTRDHMLAEDLLQHSLAQAWSAWGRLESDPEPYVRRILVNCYSSWWRRRWHGERPSDSLPEQAGPSPQDNVGDRDEVLRALDKLPRQQRAVLVLRYFEDMSEMQIAETLSISAGSVKNYAAKGLAKLRVDPDLTEAPERVGQVHQRIRRRRNNRVVAATAALVVLVTLLIAYAANPFPLPRPIPADSPPHKSAEFLDGMQVLATLPSTPFSARKTELKWTPISDREFGIQAFCVHHERGRRVRLMVQFPLEKASVDCTDHGATPDSQGWQEIALSPSRHGLRPGLPTKVTMWLDAGQGSLPAQGTFALTIGQRVALEDYRPPTVPASLWPLGRETHGPEMVRVDADGKHQVQVPWRVGGLAMYGRAQTPGHLRVVINNLPAQTLTVYDYEARFPAYELVTWPKGVPEPPSGTVVKVGIVPEGIIGDWSVEVHLAR